MREMARAEMNEIKAQLEKMDDKIKLLLLSKDPNERLLRRRAIA